MEEKLGKYIGPGFIMFIQLMFVITSLGNLTEYFYILEQHSALNNILLPGGQVRLSLIVAYLMAITIDLSILAFGVLAMRVYSVTHRISSLGSPIIGMLVMVCLSSFVNYQMTASIHLTEFDGLFLFKIPTNMINPYIPAFLPFGNLGLTFMTPSLFPKTEAMTPEAHRARLLLLQQEQELKEATARGNAKVRAAQFGGALDLAKQTGIGKKLAERLGTSDDGPQAAEETPEEIGMLVLPATAEPEWVGTSDLARIYNRHIGSGKPKVDDRKIRAWADAGKLPGQKDNDRWRFDLNELAQDQTFRTIIARHRRAEEKKKLGAKAPASRPMPDAWGDSGPLDVIPSSFAQAMDRTGPVADRS